MKIFLSVVLDAHVVAAAKTLLASNGYETVHDIAAALVEQYVKIELPKPNHLNQGDVDKGNQGDVDKGKQGILDNHASL